MKSRYLKLKEDLVTLSKLSNDVFNILDNKTLDCLLNTLPDLPEDESSTENIYSMVIIEDILDFSALMIKGLLRVRKDLKRQERLNETQHGASMKVFYNHLDDGVDHQNTIVPFEHVPYEGGEDIICVQPKECHAMEEVQVNDITNQSVGEEDLQCIASIRENAVTTSSNMCRLSEEHQTVGEKTRGFSDSSETKIIIKKDVSERSRTTCEFGGRAAKDRIAALEVTDSVINEQPVPPPVAPQVAPLQQQAPSNETSGLSEEPDEFGCGDCGRVFSNHGSLIRHTYSSHSTQISSFFKCKVCRTLFSTFTQYKDHPCFLNCKRRVERKQVEQDEDLSMKFTKVPYSVKRSEESTPQIATVDLKYNQMDATPCYTKRVMDNSVDGSEEHATGLSEETDALARGAHIGPSFLGTKKVIACQKCNTLFGTVLDLKSHVCSRIEEKRNWHTKDQSVVQSPPNDAKIPSTHQGHGTAVEATSQSTTRAKGRVCKLCGGYFATYSALIDHRHIHIKEYPFQCGSCEKAYKSAGELKRHQHVHTGERPYGCDFCGRYFALSHHLKRHIQTHLEA